MNLLSKGTTPISIVEHLTFYFLYVLIGTPTIFQVLLEISHLGLSGNKGSLKLIFQPRVHRLVLSAARGGLSHNRFERFVGFPEMTTLKNPESTF